MEPHLQAAIEACKASLQMLHDEEWEAFVIAEQERAAKVDAIPQDLDIRYLSQMEELKGVMDQMEKVLAEALGRGLVLPNPYDPPTQSGGAYSISV